MHFGFSYIGLIFLVLLFVPNLIWTKHLPKDYARYAKNENKVLLVFERIGEVAVSALVLIFSDFNPHGLDFRLLWLVGAAMAMLLYEAFWIGYFKSEKTMADFYRPLWRIPVAGATLPVAAALLIASYGQNPFLFVAGVVLGIGHIGIHLGHKREIENAGRTPVLETARLRLRVALRDEMVQFIADQTDEILISAYREMLQGAIDHPEQWNWYAIWMIEEKSGRHIGDLCFKGLHPDGSVEIGYGILDDFCGRGYATEAVRAAVEWAFHQPGVVRVEAETEPENAASQRVLAKCGFLPTGTIGKEGPRFVRFP